MNKLYLKDLDKYSKYDLDWDLLKDKTILISGSTGLVGRYLIDLLMYKNINDKLSCKVVALGRDKTKAFKLFSDYLSNNYFEFLQGDVNLPIEYTEKVDYVIHAASNTHPLQYSTDPIGTIKTNVFGTYNLLEFGKNNKISKFMLISSFEVYGSVLNNNKIGENDFGIVNSTTLRSCYPESKRLSENMCIAYSNQEGINTNIVRLSRVFGPTMDCNSSLATASFIKSGVIGSDIVLKSDGTQMYSFNYVGDAVIAILLVLLKGENKEAYNVSDEKFDSSLKNFAAIAAKVGKSKIRFDIPNDTEIKGYSNLSMTILNSDKIHELGFKCMSDLSERILTTINILKENE